MNTDDISPEHDGLFEALPVSRKPTGREGLKRLQGVPVWSRNKSRFIADYIQRFQYVTGGGVFIDGFAAPQDKGNVDEVWTAKRVLEVVPKRISRFYLADLDRDGHRSLLGLKAKHDRNPRGRRVMVYQGDFNRIVDTILIANRIRRNTPTFALLDMRTFECHWETVVKLARHKTHPKIELLYFLATGWVQRASSKKNAQALRAWWGRDDWEEFMELQQIEMAEVFCNRLQAEFGYRSAIPYPIYRDDQSRRIYYYLVHATDNERAPGLMDQAYRATNGDRKLSGPTMQRSMDEIWGDLDADKK